MKRLRSLDAVRGLAVAAMILVNSPGSDEVFAPLRHAEWNGLTPTDLIFPAFLAVMGASAAFARRGWGKALRRAALLAGLGLLANLVVYPAEDGARWPGVLQRIAACSLGVEASLAVGGETAALAGAGALLGVYALVLGAAPLTPWSNLASAADRALMGGHTLEAWGDPEGLLSTLGALATSLIGLWAGLRLRREGARGAGRLGLEALGLAALGGAWALVLPLNKHLWTSSYALLGGGLSVAGVAGAAALLDRGARAAWATPFEALGRRALAAYVLAGFAYDLTEYLRLKGPADAAAAALFGAKGGSLAYALLFVGAALAAASIRSGAPRSGTAATPCAPARTRTRSPSRRRTRTRAARTAA